MRAAVYHGQRDVRIEHVPDPPTPQGRQMVLAISAAAICGTDASEYSHGPYFAPLHQRHGGSGHLGPIILGHEFVGRIVSIGNEVTRFKVGQRVVPGAGVWCGQCDWCRAGRTNLCAHYYTLGLHTHGGLAEYATVTEEMCFEVPEMLSDEAAAITQPLAVALHAVRRAQVEVQQTIVVIGIGGIGAFIVAAAAAQASNRLIAVDIAVERLETARILGASHTINASHGSAAQAIKEFCAHEGAHVVIEASGSPSGLELALSAVRRGGRILLVGLQAEPRPLNLHALTVREIDISTTLAHVCPVDIPEALTVLTQSNLARTVIDRSIGLDSLVEEGLIALSDGTAQGKIVIDPRR